MSAAYHSILMERAAGLATIRLNRPANRNSIDGHMMSELHGALMDLATDACVRVLILRGQGDDFCAGVDLKPTPSDAAGGEPMSPRLWRQEQFRIPVLLHEMPAVTVAAVAGACAGAGFGWACGCDLRIASETARFNTAFLDVGVAGDMGGPWSLARIVGGAKARQLYFQPGKFDAAEAYRIGLVTQVSAADVFEADLAALADRLLQAAPLALSTMKASFAAAEKMGFSDYVALETERHVRLFQSDDTAEAFRARAERRAPVFRGR